MRTSLLAALIMASLLAGCADEPEVAQPDVPPASAPPLQGWVLDERMQPLAGASVELQQTGEVRVTDAVGHYAFEAAPDNGTVVLIARLDTYQVSSKQVVMQPQLALRVNFTLVPLPQSVADVQVVSLSGFLNCQGSVAADGDETVFQCAGDEAQDMWDVAVGDELAGVVVEVAWQEGTPLSHYLRATVETLSLGDQNQELAAATGPNVLRLEVGADVTSRLYGDGGLMRITVEAAADTMGMPAGASLHIAQQFEVFVSLFYVEPPAPGYTVG